MPRLLLAEDNLASQHAAEAMLHALGYSVDTCANGRAAVQACLARRYAAVLMDGFMPEMDGFEASREIRRLERGRRTPIIALLAAVRDKDRRRCFDAGMDGCLLKPITLEPLQAALVRAG